MAKLGKDLVAASAAPLVLSILAEGESYGYAIIQRVHQLSDGHIRWTDGMLYPVLHRLEAQGLITSKWKTAENGRKRKYYSLKRQGRQSLEYHKAQWRLVTGTLTAVWG
jgi:PadR family transcriptional regulator